MSTPLRLRAALGPQAGDAVALRFGSAGVLPVIPPGAGLRMVASAGWRHAAPVMPGRRSAPWQAAGQQRGACAAPWRSTAPVTPVSIGAGWAALAALLAPPVRAPWGAALALLAPPVRVGWHGGQAAQAEARMPWHGAAPLAAWALAAWHGGRPAVRPARASWHGAAAGQVVLRALWQGGLAAASHLAAPWQAGQTLVSYGGPWVSFVPPVLPGHVCYLPPAGLAVAQRFSGLLMSGLGALRFICLDRRATVRIPSLRVYMVTNAATLTRVDGGVNIPCFGLSLSLDRDSWAWGFSATLPASSIALIEPTSGGEAVELEAVVNGMAIRLIAESMSRERVFGQIGVRVQGRGKTAVLDSPYSPIVTFSNGAALTHQQLLAAALPSSWSADYGLTAWLVPAGVWSHQGTSMTAALALAAAGGGYIQPHPTADEIRVLPQYPVAPWGWSGVTPDFELPSAVLTREGIEWAEKPRYNGVYVAGPAAGKAYLVKRAGTAGDVLAPMVTEPLATHVDAGRQRGLPIVADVGRQARLSLRLPVLPATSIIHPGKFVRYTDGAITRLGLSRSVGVEVTWGNNEALQVWQTIGVETHVL